MSRKTNARLAGFMFLFYIATALPCMILFDQATAGTGIAAKLANIAQHAPQVQLWIVFSVITIFAALVLAVALYALTSEEDPDLAVLALSCRVGEGVIATISTLAMVGLLWIATTTAGAGAMAANAIGFLLLRVQEWSTIVGTTVFAVGSTLYSWLFLRGRSIPVPLAWLGVLASTVLVVALPAQRAGFMKGTGYSMWIPMLVFEVTLGLWLLVKGVAVPNRLQSKGEEKCETPSTLSESFWSAFSCQVLSPWLRRIRRLPTLRPSRVHSQHTAG